MRKLHDGFIDGRARPMQRGRSFLDGDGRQNEMADRLRLNGFVPLEDGRADMPKVIKSESPLSYVDIVFPGTVEKRASEPYTIIRKTETVTAEYVRKMVERKREVPGMRFYIENDRSGLTEVDPEETAKAFMLVVRRR